MEGLVGSSTFAFEYGRRQYKEQSYFYYNVSADDFGQAEYSESDREYWKIPLRKASINS